MFVVDPDTVRRVDAQTIEGGIAGTRLMDQAGRGAAAVLLDDEVPRRGTTVIVCGKGNNGGDGLVVARELHLAHEDVVAAVLTTELSGEAAWALADAREHGVRILTLGDDPVAALSDLLDENPGVLLVDAVFGTGTRLPLRAPYDGVARTMGECGRRIVGLDGPSGLDGATGAVDRACPVADVTIAFGLPKWGMVLAPGRAHCGRLHVIELDFEVELVEREAQASEDRATWIDARWAAGRWPQRAVDAHKYRSGSVFAVGGARGMSGAVALACNAAYRAGAGYVEATVPLSVAPIIDPLCVETLVHGGAETDRGGLAASVLSGLVERAGRHGALLVGPGAGDDSETATLILDLVERLDMPMVVDADGLNAASRAGRDHDFAPVSVITPHTGELSRLLGLDGATIESDRRHHVREAARRLQTVVLHKGAPTFVAAPDGTLAVIATGGPELATAGTGDVLAGAIAALLAAGVDAFDAACLGAFVHGDAGARAARDLGVGPVMAHDVLDRLAFAVRDLERGGAR